jgi:hypothetical protein
MQKKVIIISDKKGLKSIEWIIATVVDGCLKREGKSVKLSKR